MQSNAQAREVGHVGLPSIMRRRGARADAALVCSVMPRSLLTLPRKRGRERVGDAGV